MADAKKKDYMECIETQKRDNVKILAVLVRLKCNNCKSEWGVYQKEDGTLPEGWDICLKCLGKEMYSSYVKGTVNNYGKNENK